MGHKEAVFSSSEDRIRASQASILVAEPSLVSESPHPRVNLRWASRAAESLFAVLFPSECRICGEPLVKISRLPVCEQCLAGMRPLEGKLCAICGERVLSIYALSDAHGEICCPVCRRIEPPFERAVAYGSYEGGLRELIHLLKYGGVRPAANVLGRMLAETICALDLVRDDAQSGAPVPMIPVPLHRNKRHQRGFNQAELIARAALKSHSLKGKFAVADDVLLRQRETASQIGLTSHQRRANLRGAFAVTHAEQIGGREVLLVDDVYTTGTTASECARVLRRAGATRVWVATVARTLNMASHHAELKPFAGPAESEVEQIQPIPLAKAAGG
jgi:ComF family protein